MAGECSVTEHRPAGAQEQEIFDMQTGQREVWDRCTVTAHFSPDHDVDATLQVGFAYSTVLLGLNPNLWCLA